jgi:hypothetical protein
MRATTATMPLALPGNALAVAVAKEAHEGVSGPGEVRHPGAARHRCTGVRGERREEAGGKFVGTPVYHSGFPVMHTTQDPMISMS